VRGSSYELDKNYTLDVYKMCVQVTTADTTRAGAEVVKHAATPLMSSLLYPILQAIDEEYLKVDLQFGGVDQRKIFMFSRDHMPKLGYKKRAYFMNPLIPGLGKSGKMSSSEPLSKIDFDDTPQTLQKKIRLAFCESPTDLAAGSSVSDAMCNGVLALAKFVVMPYLLQSSTPFLAIEGGATYRDYATLAADFEYGRLHPSKLKPAIADAITRLLQPLRDALSSTGDGYSLLCAAYPEVIKQREKDEKMAAANAKGATTVACLKIVIGVVGDKVDTVAPNLFASEVDVGNKQTMKIVSRFVAPGAKLALLANGGASFPMKGVKSDASVLFVEHGDKSEALTPPASAVAGDLVTFDDYEPAYEPEVKSKTWSKLAPRLKTDDAGVPVYVGDEDARAAFSINGTPFNASTIKNANIAK